MMALRLTASSISDTIPYPLLAARDDHVRFFCLWLSAIPVAFYQKLIAVRQRATFAAMTTLVLSPDAGGSALARDWSRPSGTSLLLITLLLAGLIFVQAAPLLRWFDPNAAAVGTGAMSLVWLATAALILFLTVSRWLLGLLYMHNPLANAAVSNFVNGMPENGGRSHVRMQPDGVMCRSV